jgi:hypothetical protein
MAKAKGVTHNSVRRFKSLAIGLKELEPFIRNGEHLQTGRPFTKLEGMRSREALANWLICAAADFAHSSERMSFTSDPTGGDGIIYDSKTKRTWRTEHVMVRRPISEKEKENPTPIETQILQAVTKKQKKGGIQYASGKQLVVFVDSGGGNWHPNKVARELPQPLLFDAVWVVGLHGEVVAGKYVYGVTQLDLANGNAPIWLVRIARTFRRWAVSKIQ